MLTCSGLRPHRVPGVMACRAVLWKGRRDKLRHQSCACRAHDLHFTHDPGHEHTAVTWTVRASKRAYDVYFEVERCLSHCFATNLGCCQAWPGKRLQPCHTLRAVKLHPTTTQASYRNCDDSAWFLSCGRGLASLLQTSGRPGHAPPIIAPGPTRPVNDPQVIGEA